MSDNNNDNKIETSESPVPPIPGYELDAESNEQFRNHPSGVRIYVKAFEKLGLSFHAVQVETDDAANDIAKMCELFGPDFVRTAANVTLANMQRQRARAKHIPDYQDAEAQKKALRDLASKPHGLLTTEDEALEFRPGERELTYNGLSAKFRKLLNEAKETTDPEKRKALLDLARDVRAKAEAAAMREMELASR